MKWQSFSDMTTNVELSPEVSYEQMSDQDIEQVTSLLRVWYPDIVVGAESRHLDPIFYRQNCFLKDGNDDAPVFAFICRTRDTDEIVAMMTMEKNSPARQITSIMGAVEPSKRGFGIGQTGPAILEACGRSIGAAIAYYFATLKSTRSQLNAERHGFQLVGIVPGFDVDAISPNKHLRVYEGIYAKYLGTASELTIPRWDSLTPKSRDLWTALFGKHPDLSSAPAGEEK